MYAEKGVPMSNATPLINFVPYYPFSRNSNVGTDQVLQEKKYDKLTIEDMVAHAASLSLDELRAEAENRAKYLLTLSENQRVKQGYGRDPYIRQFAKKWANGVCQLCDNPAPFVKPSGEPYLESHHIKPLSEGGSDSIENVIALCPNCHRKMHIIKSICDLEKLYLALKRALEK